MTCAAARNSAPSDQYSTASDIITTTSESALWMGWRCKSRFSAPPSASAPKMMKSAVAWVPPSPSFDACSDDQFRFWCRSCWLSSDCKAVRSYPRMAMTKLVTMMLAMASGSRNFQPKLISWS